MKIAVTAATPDIEAEADPRFGDAACFIMVDSETMEWQAFANPAASPWGGGHGGVAARFVLMQEADAVISGDFCPHSFAGLMAAGVPLYEPAATGTVRDEIERLKTGQLQHATGPSRMGHHGMHHG